MQNSPQPSKQQHVLCAFFGGPWADLRLYMEDDREEWHIPERLSLYRDYVQSYEPTRFVTYRRRGIADDGTRMFYAELS